MNEQHPYQPRQTPPPYNPGGGARRGVPPHAPMQPPPQYGPQQNCYGPQNYPGDPYRQPWQPYYPGQHQSNGMGTAGFVLSLVSIFIGWVPLVGWLIWILASVFSFIGLFKQPRGLAIAGVIISLVLIPMIVTLLVAIDAFTSAMFLI